MNELIPIHNNDDGNQAVMGRDLHAFLGVNSRYREWFPRMVEYGFEEAKDYAPKNRRVQDSLGREREALDHVISLDMAKEISMIQRTEKGKQARQYFIECERRVKDHQATPALPQDYASALREAANQYERAEIESARADKAEEQAERFGSWKRAVEGGAGVNVSDYARKYFSEVPYMTFFEHLYHRGWLIDQRGTRVGKNGRRKDGHDHMKPTAKGRKFFYLHDRGVQGGRRRLQTKIIPKRELELKESLVGEGLVPNENDTGLVLIDANGDIQTS